MKLSKILQGNLQDQSRAGAGRQAMVSAGAHRCRERRLTGEEQSRVRQVNGSSLQWTGLGKQAEVSPLKQVIIWQATEADRVIK